MVCIVNWDARHNVTSGNNASPSGVWNPETLNGLSETEKTGLIAYGVVYLEEDKSADQLLSIPLTYYDKKCPGTEWEIHDYHILFNKPLWRLSEWNRKYPFSQRFPVGILTRRNIRKAKGLYPRPPAIAGRFFLAGRDCHGRPSRNRRTSDTAGHRVHRVLLKGENEIRACSAGQGVRDEKPHVR